MHSNNLPDNTNNSQNNSPSDTGHGVTYRQIARGATPLTPGTYKIQIFTGRYKDAVTGREYHVLEVTEEPTLILYRRQGETDAQLGLPDTLGIVEAIGETPGGIIDAPTEGVQ